MTLLRGNREEEFPEGDGSSVFRAFALVRAFHVAHTNQFTIPNRYQQFRDRASKRIYISFPALRSRKFRLFFIGQLLSMSGTFMTQQLTIPWLTYSLTNSAWLLGLAGFLQFLPTLLLIPFSGVLSDRWNRRDLLMLVQIVGIVISAILTVLTFLDVITFGSLLLLSVLIGLLKGLDMPVRHSIVTELVDDRADWSNAIALNSVMLSSALLLGPAIGGLLITTVGVKYCFLFDTLSYIAAILTLKAMHIRPKLRQLTAQSTKVWQDLQEGFLYIDRARPIHPILLVLALQSLFGISLAHQVQRVRYLLVSISACGAAS